MKYLGRTGQCKVNETPKGWFITFMGGEPETLSEEGLKNKREGAEFADEERHEMTLAEQIQRAARNHNPKLEQPEPEKTELRKKKARR